MTVTIPVDDLPPGVASVLDYGLGGPTERTARFGGRLVVHESNESRFCSACGTVVRVWRFAQNPPDAYGETDEGKAYWARRPWLESPCPECWIQRDRDSFLANLRDRSRLHAKHELLLARRQGDGREVKHYLPREDPDAN